jgi:hypothetical protein
LFSSAQHEGDAQEVDKLQENNRLLRSNVQEYQSLAADADAVRFLTAQATHF